MCKVSRWICYSLTKDPKWNPTESSSINQCFKQYSLVEKSPWEGVFRAPSAGTEGPAGAWLPVAHCAPTVTSRLPRGRNCTESRDMHQPPFPHSVRSTEWSRWDGGRLWGNWQMVPWGGWNLKKQFFFPSLVSWEWGLNYFSDLIHCHWEAG